jgi:hypothetical protein
MHISSKTLFRFGGAAAIVGGLLRVFSSFLPYQEASPLLETLYGLVDICLLFGLLAIYLKHAERLGGLGLIAFVLALTGVASIVGPDAIMFGVNFYVAGAGILITGTLLLSIQMLRDGTLVCASILWVLSFVLTIAAISFSHPLLFSLAGVNFGAAYILAGTQLFRSK